MTFVIQATRFPDKAFMYLMSIIGKKYDDPAVQQYKKQFPFYNLVKDEERGTILFKIDEYVASTPAIMCINLNFILNRH